MNLRLYALIALAVGLSGMVTMFGCSKNKTVVSTPDAGGITIESVREEMPKFKRVYKSNLSNGRSLIVTIYNWDGFRTNVMKSGELDQPDKRWVLFDPDAVADKILDAQLVPEVQALCDRINQIDVQFRASKPPEFTDEKGVTWRRVTP
jgi:hypothetical protein